MSINFSLPAKASRKVSTPTPYTAQVPNKEGLNAQPQTSA
jgi:hypothetical protein